MSHTRTSVRRQKEQIERREAIIEAAREVFFEKGFTAATMDAIAGKCDLAKGTLYLYFKSKEELYIALMAEGMELLRKELEKVPDLPLPTDALVAEVLKTYLAFYRMSPQYFRIMFLSSQPDVRERVPHELIRRCMDTARGCMEILSGVIRKGTEGGVFRQVNAWAVANILWATATGIIMSYEQEPMYRDEIVGMALEAILQDALDLVLNGLRSSA